MIVLLYMHFTQKGVRIEITVYLFILLNIYVKHYDRFKYNFYIVARLVLDRLFIDFQNNELFSEFYSFHFYGFSNL